VNLADALKLELRFNGAAVNTTMVRTIHLVRQVVTDRSRQLMGMLDREFGQEVLSAQYSKLRLLLNSCKGKSETFEWVLEAMISGLRRKEITPEDLNTVNLSKPRNGAPSFVSICSAQQLLINHMQQVAAAVQSVDAKMADELHKKVVSKMGSPLLYNEAFPLPKAEQQVEVVDDADAPAAALTRGSGGEVTELETPDLIAQLMHDSPRGTIMFAEVMKKVYDGTYDDCINKLAAHASPQSVVTDQEASVLGAFAKDVGEVLRALHTSGEVVSSDSTAAPPQATLRQLVRQKSDDGDVDQAAASAERGEVWRKAVAQRKKLVALTLVQSQPRTEQALRDAEKKGTTSLQHASKLEKSSVAVGSCDTTKVTLYLMSGDLHSQRGPTPWLIAGEPDEKFLIPTAKFLASQRGQGVATLAVDGCQRKVRKILDDELGGVTGTAEVFFVYKAAWNTWSKKNIS
jgi:hypothetical protein